MKRSFKIKIKKPKTRIPITKNRSEVFKDKRTKRQRTRNSKTKKEIEEYDD